MKPLFIILMIIFICFFSLSRASSQEQGCFTGAFIADNPTKSDLKDFKDSYGRMPYLVMIFIDWESYPDENVLNDIYKSGSKAIITWEPWRSYNKEPIDYKGLLAGSYDEYINAFALRLKNIKEDVFLRFAHEANGNWYPWSADKLGNDAYVAIFRHIKDIFDKEGVDNVKWVFSINWENVPKANDYKLFYPGADYVDYIGIDGYNWGNAKNWSKWLSFQEIFSNAYSETTKFYGKPVIISEFSSTSTGGDKAKWIKDAMLSIKKMGRIRGFVIFNLDKEQDWSFPAEEASGKAFKAQLDDPYFKDQ